MIDISQTDAADASTLKQGLAAVWAHGSTTILENIANGNSPVAPDAAYNLGAIHAKNPAPQYRSQAREWFEKAATANHPDALYCLGDMIAGDATLAENAETKNTLHAESIDLYTRAMNLGHRKSTRRLIHDAVEQHADNPEAKSTRIVEILNAFGAANLNRSERYEIFCYAEEHGGRTQNVISTIRELQASRRTTPTPSV